MISSGKMRNTPYISLALVANALVWGSALLYLSASEPTYVSEWAATLPDIGERTNINLPTIGTTTSDVNSSFDRNNRDPRENYKFIATSDSVIQDAANRLGMSSGEFGQPRVEMIDNTTLIQFSVESNDPEKAYAKALTLNEVMNERIITLRGEEANTRKSELEGALEEAELKLDLAQDRLSAYKANSGLVSRDQLNRLSGNLEDLRIERANTLALQKETNARFSELSRGLNVSGEEVADALLLNADEVFIQNLAAYADSTRNVESLKQQLGPNHPVMARELAQQASTREATFVRAQQLLGRPLDERSLAQISLRGGGGGSREGLFEQTFIAKVEGDGLAANFGEINNQIAELDSRMRNLASQEAALNALERDVNVAEAIFTSYSTRLNNLNTVAFGSFPPLQIISEPVQPEEASSPRASLVLLGTGVASFLITAAIIALWRRQYIYEAAIGERQPKMELPA